jgi:hypothetical protein
MIITMFSLVFYRLTSLREPTPFNYFTRLAESFIQGRAYLAENPSWLNELVPGEISNRWYVVYPPMPAIMAIPFVVLDVAGKSQTFISILFGSINIGLMYLVGKRVFDSHRIAALLAVMLGFGTNHWYLATDGSVWYIAHIFAVFFILISMLLIGMRQRDDKLIITSKPIRWLAAGLCIGAAYWSRLPAILVTPLFFGLPIILAQLNTNALLRFNFVSVVGDSGDELTLRFDKTKLNIMLFVIGVGIFVVASLSYNYMRFGSIFDGGYDRIPGVLDEPFFDKGIFSFDYLPRNIAFILARMPLAHDQFPYVKPSFYGMSLFLTSPFLIFMLFAQWRKHWLYVFLVTGILMLMPGLLHGTPGFAQFGYRFAMEATPLFLLIFGSFLQRKQWWLSIPFMVLAVLVNFWGIYFIRILETFGW